MANNNRHRRVESRVRRGESRVRRREFQGTPPDPGIPPGFADMPEGRAKFEIRRTVYSTLQDGYKSCRVFRPDMWAMKQMNRDNLSFKFEGTGDTPGVEVGDKFKFRSEMVVVGLHQEPVAGICCEDREDVGTIATSIVVSGGYEDNDDQGDRLIYSGHGGNDYKGHKKQIANQTLTMKNAAMMKNLELKIPVRVTRGLNTGKSNGWYKIYSYHGLYNVISYESPPEKGISGYKLYKFELVRCPGQPKVNIEPVAFGGDQA